MIKVDTRYWEFNADIPFYVDMKKPRPSLSEHDDKHPTYWHYDDGSFVAMCLYLTPKLIEYIEKK